MEEPEIFHINPSSKTKQTTRSPIFIIFNPFLPLTNSALRSSTLSAYGRTIAYIQASNEVCIDLSDVNLHPLHFSQNLIIST